MLKNFMVTFVDFYGWNNNNTALLTIEFSYGLANGYLKEFCLSFFNLSGFYIHKDSYNGHARFSCGCYIFSLQFDWFDKKSVQKRVV